MIMNRLIVVSLLSMMIVAGLWSCTQSMADSKNGGSEQIQVPAASPQVKVEAVDQKEYKVLISTEYGDMVVILYNETPLHRDNFLKLAKEGFYDGTIFHRVIRNFMIQGGDPETRNAVAGAQYGNGGPPYTIPAEFNKKYFHKKGALAAARTGDNMNPKKESSGSQFYIVQGQVLTFEQLTSIETRNRIKFSPEQKQAYTTVGGTPFLDQSYTVFGEVVSGLEVIDKIAAVRTLPGDRPEKDVKMTVTLVE
jgi:peptidyl-prolyl cis-trans isomerase B (cyclophilin B)